MVSKAHAKYAKSAKFLRRSRDHETPPEAATLKRRTSAATRKSAAVEQIRNGATVRENDTTLRGINAQVREYDTRFGENYARLRENYARVRERKKPTVGELFISRLK